MITQDRTCSPGGALPAGSYTLEVRAVVGMLGMRTGEIGATLRVIG